MICPKCHYQRQLTDTAPQWQCPACGVAYAKVSSSAPLPVTTSEKVSIENQYGKRTTRENVFTLFVLLSVLLLVASWYGKDKLPVRSKMLSEMFNEPIQTARRDYPFDFSYRGESYQVTPVADYEIWGLVVTHNDISGFTDIIHDENSVDIKDLCVIWGANLENEDYRDVSYSSGDFTCYWSYSRPLDFRFNKIANNHLLSDDAAVRERIRQVVIGDQVHIRGMLVNYFPVSNPNWIRKTSTTREDTGNHACEVVFVQQFEILDSANAFDNTLFNISKWLVLVALFLKIGAMSGMPLLAAKS